MSFAEFIDKFQPSYKLHTTGKSYCIITTNDIPIEFKKKLEFADFPHKLYWNANSKCWLIAAIYESALIEHNLNKIDLIDSTFTSTDIESSSIDFDKEREEFFKEKEIFLKEKEAFLKEKEDLLKNKEKVNKYAQCIIRQNKIINDLKDKLKKLEENTDHLTDTEISSIYYKIFQFMKYTHNGGIEKASDPNSIKSIHDIKLFQDKTKKMFFIKFKNNKGEWDYNPEYMYLPKLRK
jgi:hypothetical protein